MQMAKLALIFFGFPLLCQANVTYYAGKIDTVNSSDKRVVPVPFVYERKVLPQEKKVIETSHSIVDGKPYHQVFIYDHANGVFSESGHTGTFKCQGKGKDLDSLTSCTYDLSTDEYSVKGTDSYTTDAISFDAMVVFKKQKLNLVTKGKGEKVDEKTYKAKFKALFPETLR